MRITISLDDQLGDDESEIPLQSLVIMITENTNYQCIFSLNEVTDNSASVIFYYINIILYFHIKSYKKVCETKKNLLRIFIYSIKYIYNITKKHLKSDRRKFL